MVITLGKERSKVLEVSERPSEKEGKSARLNAFQPLGRSLSEDRTYLGTRNSKETTAGPVLTSHPDPWRRTVTEEADIDLSNKRKEIIDKMRSSANKNSGQGETLKKPLKAT